MNRCLGVGCMYAGVVIPSNDPAPNTLSRTHQQPLPLARGVDEVDRSLGREPIKIWWAGRGGEECRRWMIYDEHRLVSYKRASRTHV